MRLLLSRRAILLLCCVFFFFSHTATTEIYTLSLHDALPIFAELGAGVGFRLRLRGRRRDHGRDGRRLILRRDGGRRSEEHTSELQSHSDLVCRLLLEKKKK